MILVSRLNGTDLWLNPLLIEAMEHTPDTVVTLTNGHKYVLRESPDVITTRIREFYQRIGLVGKANAGEAAP